MIGPMAQGLSGSRVLVVGASAGIGRAVALRAAREGAEIAVVARRKEALEILAQEAGGGAIIVADLSVSADCARIAEEASASLGKIDVVLFVAATARLRTLKDMTAAEWAVTLNTNLVGVNLTIASLLPHLSEGALVLVASSESAGRPFYALGAYAASKSALEDTMRAWRIERPEVRFTTIVVGTTVPTEFASNFDPQEMIAAFPIWAAQGNAPADYMQADEVADVTVGFIETLLPNKTVGVESLSLRSPAPLTGNADTMIETAAVMSPAPT
jgi:NAD(P)-dependent dehydrogenase (short-subunit alcohol dehydrogenase family)